MVLGVEIRVRKILGFSHNYLSEARFEKKIFPQKNYKLSIRWEACQQEGNSARAI